MDLPIYRCSNRDYQFEQQANLGHNDATRSVGSDYVFKAWGSAGHKRRPLQHWRYNEILGWLRLYDCGGALAGDLYLAKAKRMSGRQKRMLKYLSRAFEIRIERDSSNEQICARLFDELGNLADRPPVQERFLDLSVLRNLAPFLNWRRLLRME